MVKKAWLFRCSYIGYGETEQEAFSKVDFDDGLLDDYDSAIRVPEEDLQVEEVKNDS